MEPLGLARKVVHLRRVPSFGRFTERQLTAVARLTEFREASAGQVLVRAGEPGNELFMILEGAARVDVPRGKRVRLGPGEFFGEMSLLDGEPRSATVVAETSLRLLVVDRRDFWRLLRELPELAERLLVTLSRRLREAESSPLY